LNPADLSKRQTDQIICAAADPPAGNPDEQPRRRNISLNELLDNRHELPLRTRIAQRADDRMLEDPLIRRVSTSRFVSLEVVAERN
jgi:hypothetical protein